MAPEPRMMPSVMSLMEIMKYMGLTMRRNSMPDCMARVLPAPRNSPIIWRLNTKYSRKKGTAA